MYKALAETIIRGPDWRGKARVLRFLLNRLDGTPLQSRYGPRLTLRVRDYTNRAAITGMYHADYDDVFAEVEKLTPGMAFLDIGANAGLFSMVAGARVGQQGAVIAFEPALQVYRDLVGNAAVNALPAFYPFNAAIGDTTKIARFASGGAGHSGVGHLDGQGDLSVLQVCAGDLNPIISQIVGDRRTVVKIDVEGAEELVIDSVAIWLAQPAVEKVIVEIDPKFLGRFDSSAPSLYEKMGSLGFRGLRGLGAAEHYNEIFVRTAN